MEDFNALKLALTIISVKGDLRQPANHAMSRVPAGFSRWATAQSYLFDIERILLELEMALEMVRELPEDSFFEGKQTDPEDYIMYHQGYYLELVHQLKDKLCQMLYAIIVADQTYKGDVKRKVYSKLTNSEKTKKIKGLVSYLEKWDAYREMSPEGEEIALALKKRGTYHHFRNPLTRDENYFQTKHLRTLGGEEFQSHLSDYGKRMIAEKGQKNLEAWQTETVRKMQETLNTVKASINDIASLVVSYYRLPNQEGEGRRVMMRYMPLIQNAEVAWSERAWDDIPELFQMYYRILRGILEGALGEQFLSLYSLGSASRGDFQFGISDVNTVIVVSDEIENEIDDVKEGVDKKAREFEFPTNTQVFSRSQFMSDENEKLRFICKSDGVLIAGENLLNNEKRRNKSFELAWLLNSDFKAELAKAKELVEANPEIGAMPEYEHIARDLAKRAFRLSFGQIIGNHIVYTTRYAEMRNLMNTYMPDNKPMNDRLYVMATSRLRVDKEGILGVIASYEEKFIPLYNAIDSAVNGEKSSPEEEAAED